MIDRRHAIVRRILKRCTVSTTLAWHGTPCLLWDGPTSGNGRGGGYPRMTLDGMTVAVHKALWTCCYGYMPSNRTVDHECKNRLCLNPHHLSAVSMLENYRRRDGKKPRKGSEYAVSVPADILAIVEEVFGSWRMAA